MFCGMILQNYLMEFMITLFLGSLDFWIVKNIAGRLLIGLRWHIDYDEDGY